MMEDYYNKIFNSMGSLGIHLQIIHTDCESAFSCNVLMILDEEERSSSSSRAYVRRAFHIFDNNVQSISKLYYRDDDSNLKKSLEDDILYWYDKIDNLPAFIFDPHGLIDQYDLFRTIKKVSNKTMIINLREE